MKKHTALILLMLLVWLPACRSRARVEIKIVSDRMSNKINVVIRDEQIKEKIIKLLLRKQWEPCKFMGDYFLEIVKNGTKTKIKVYQNWMGTDGRTYFLEENLGDIIQKYLKRLGKLKWAPSPTQ